MVHTPGLTVWEQSRHKEQRDEISNLSEDVAHAFSVVDPDEPSHAACVMVAAIVWCVREVSALRSREEVRHRIKPIVRGEKPERAVGGT